MMETREQEIDVRSEMLSTINKIEAIRELFDVGGDTSTERFTSTGFIGMAELLGGIEEEILTKSDDLNQQIEEMAEPLKDKELLSILKMCKRSGMDVADEFCNYLAGKHSEKAQ